MFAPAKTKQAPAPQRTRAGGTRRRLTGRQVAYLAWAGLALLAQAYPGPLPHIPYAWMTAAVMVALAVRRGWERWEHRRDGGWLAARRRRRYQGLASQAELSRRLSLRAARRHARVTRPQSGRLLAAHAGVSVGRGGPLRRPLLATAEDSYLLVGMRSGKTAHLAGVVWDAPGAVLTTSTRVDLYRHTAVPRAERGRLWVLNPGGDAGIPSTLAWSPLDGCESAAGAIQSAGYLMAAAPKDASGKDAWWDGQGHVLLRLMLHAAALAGGTIIDTEAWVRDPVSTEPLSVLAGHPAAAPGWAAELADLAAVDGDMLRSVSRSAAAALSWLADPAVAAIACAPRGDWFNAAEFVTAGTDTMYLIGADRPHNSLSPYFAAFAGHLWETAKRQAAAAPGMRLDPPLTMALDEPAITCPVPLDRWSAEAGGHGITLHAAVQSPSQLAARWGEHGKTTIWNNATVKLIFGGLTNHDDLEAISAVCGHRDTWDAVSGPGGKSRQPRTERVLPPERIRLLPPGQALLLHRATRPVITQLTPVWDRPGYTLATVPATAADPRLAVAAAVVRDGLEAAHRPAALAAVTPLPVTTHPAGETPALPAAITRQ